MTEKGYELVAQGIFEKLVSEKEIIKDIKNLSI